MVSPPMVTLPLQWKVRLATPSSFSGRSRSDHQKQAGVKAEEGTGSDIRRHIACPHPDLRGICGSKLGGGHHAKDFTGLVVVYTYGTLGTVQGLIGRRLQSAVQGQIHPFPPPPAVPVSRV